MARTPRESSLDQPPYGVYVIVAGLVAVTTVALAAIVRYDNAADVVTVLGGVTGVIAALVGAYFGMRGATLAQQKAKEAGESAPQSAVQTPANNAEDGQTSAQPPVFVYNLSG